MNAFSFRPARVGEVAGLVSVQSILVHSEKHFGSGVGLVIKKAEAASKKFGRFFMSYRFAIVCSVARSFGLSRILGTLWVSVGNGILAFFGVLALMFGEELCFSQKSKVRLSVAPADIADYSNS